MAGMGILLFFAVVSGLASVIAPYNPYEQAGRPFEKPSWDHWLGCNDVGHDLFSELLYGGRMSLSIGLFAAFYATIVATIIALLAGYLQGGTDRVLMRIVDIVMALPFLPLVIVLGVFLGPGMNTQILVISLVMWGHPARELR
ncbi:MAG: ABC transporter, partial [Spirochaetales bacterium]